MAPSDAAPMEGARARNGHPGYTPIIKSPSVIMKECDERYFKYNREPNPRQPRGVVGLRKWCHFHPTIGHHTNHWQALRRSIENLIQHGRLQEYVFKAKGSPTQDLELDPHKGNLKPSRKRKLRTKQEIKAYEEHLREPYGGYTSKSSSEDVRTTKKENATKKEDSIRISPKGRKPGTTRIEKAARKSEPSNDWLYNPRFLSFAEPALGETSYPTRYVL